MDNVKTSIDPVAAVAAAIDEAKEDEDRIVNAAPKKPRLYVDNANPDYTVYEMRDLLAVESQLYDRGVPVRLAFDQAEKGTRAQVITAHYLVLEVHRICRPCSRTNDGEQDVRLPQYVARMYLDCQGEWNLPPLNGIASAPLLQEDGEIGTTHGYDQASGMWCENIPELDGLIADRPTRTQAEAALRSIRETFKTFCFADAETLEDEDGVSVVDVRKPPGRDESAFLVALLTAACRPSLYLAPGVLLRAPSMSGAGAGKGLLARCICNVAFGRAPHAVTAGATAEELEKRIAAELMGGSCSLFIDNLNNTNFRSDLLASAITERPGRVRLLGKSEMLPVNASALVLLTGNGLSLSEDLARRFLVVELDPGTEDPEARPFTTDILAEVKSRRAELLAALLTIWRWGRMEKLSPGMPLGSFEQWGSWVRDPLLALGCQDPAERVSETKEYDFRRQQIAELFQVWWQRHADRPVACRDLHSEVRDVADPQGRGRQYLSSFLQDLSGTRMAGFVMTRQSPVGNWGTATYAVKKTSDEPDA